MNDKSSNNPDSWLCRIGFHKFRVIEVKFGFGSARQVEVVECVRCGKVATRRSTN